LVALPESKEKRNLRSLLIFQITGFLKQAEAGMPIKELCIASKFSDATLRAKYI